MGRTATNVTQIALILLALAGGWFGFSYINQASSAPVGGVNWILAVALVTVATVVIGLLLHVVLHEAGHLVGGLLTGHRFVSFFVLNLSIMKENGKLVIKKYGLAGYGGGCMLSPPDMKNGTYPFKLYISGGVLINILIAAVCLYAFFRVAATADLWARALLVTGITGAFFGISNLLPSNVSVPNDGYILFNLGRGKNADMRRGFWSTFRMQALLEQGTRPRDIPPELFNWVDASDISDLFTRAVAGNHYKYLLDRQELDKARALMQTLCNTPHHFPDTQKMAFYCELLFHELINECRQEEIDRYYTTALQDYIKAAHAEVSVQRLMYAYARLVKKDAEKAKEYLGLFHKACTIPLQASAAPGEKALVALVDAIADKM